MATPLPLQRHAASPTTATGDWLAAIDTSRYEKVQRRVIGQLLQTLLYEAALPYRCEPLGEHQHRFSVPLGDGVEYRCNGLLSTSFELIRLDHASLERVDSAGQRSTPDLHGADRTARAVQGQPALGAPHSGNRADPAQGPASAQSGLSTCHASPRTGRGCTGAALHGRPQLPPVLQVANRLFAGR